MINPCRLVSYGLLMLLMALMPFLHAQRVTTEHWPDGHVKMTGTLKGKKRQGTFVYLNELQDTIRVEQYEKGRLLSARVIPQPARILDSKGRLVEFRRYDLEGNLRDAHGIHLFGGENDPKDCIVRYEYNEKGQLVKMIHADEHGEVLKRHPVAPITEYTYNESGKVTLQWHRDADGNAYEDAMGMAFTRYTYDAAGRQVSRSCHGLDSSLVGADFGTATLLHEYDASGCKTKTLRLDEEGDTAVMDMSGPPVLLFRCDGNGQRMAELAYERRGHFLGMIKSHYDAQGRVIRSEFYDGKDTTSMVDYTVYEYTDSGFVAAKRTYSPQGRLLDEDKSEIMLAAPGWTWPDMPSMADQGRGGGRLQVAITIRPDGTLSACEPILESCDTDLSDEAHDWLNHLKLTPTGAKQAEEGKVTFVRLE